MLNFHQKHHWVKVVILIRVLPEMPITADVQCCVSWTSYICCTNALFVFCQFRKWHQKTWLFVWTVHDENNEDSMSLKVCLWLICIKNYLSRCCGPTNVRVRLCIQGGCSFCYATSLVCLGIFGLLKNCENLKWWFCEQFKHHHSIEWVHCDTKICIIGFCDILIQPPLLVTLEILTTPGWPNGRPVVWMSSCLSCVTWWQKCEALFDG